MSRFMRKPEAVEAEQFFPERRPWPRGVEDQPCHCASLAQDGRRCERCKDDGRRYGIVRLGIGRGQSEICRGEWIVVVGSEHGYPVRRVMSDAAFRAAYEAAEGNP